MYFLLLIGCLVSTSHAYRANSMYFFDDTTYNPCGTKANLYYYPDPTDAHQYYQCDESGNAYLRTCAGSLIWDEVFLTCNWPSAVSSPARIGQTTSSTWPPQPTTTQTSITIPWTVTTSFQPPIRPSWPPTTTQTNWPTLAPQISLCSPINPCGDHGQCIEPPRRSLSTTNRFACICSENWYGRLCDRQIDELTTPSPFISDQNKIIDEITNNASLPLEVESDPKLVFYGLNAGKPADEIRSKQKRKLFRSQ